MNAKTYRKKPVEIQAMQLTDTNAGEVAFWVNSHFVDEQVAIIRGGPSGGSVEATLIIKTLEGNHLAQEGDLIIRGVQHEFYPCKPDIFAKTYDAMEDAK